MLQLKSFQSWRLFFITRRQWFADDFKFRKSARWVIDHLSILLGEWALSLLWTVNLFSLKMQNFCVNNQCSSNSRCQTGFTDHGYRCVCSAGYTGEYCTEGYIHQIFLLCFESPFFTEKLHWSLWFLAPIMKNGGNRRRFSCRFENVEDTSVKLIFAKKM